MKAERCATMVNGSMGELAKLFKSGINIPTGILRDKIKSVTCNLRSEDGVFQRYLVIIIYNPTYQKTFTIRAHVDGGELTKSIRVVTPGVDTDTISLYQQPDHTYQNKKSNIIIEETTLIRLIQHILLYDKDYNVKHESREEVFF